MYVLHNLHGHLLGFHTLIILLNNFTEFKTFGIMAHLVLWPIWYYGLLLGLRVPEFPPHILRSAHFSL